MKESLRKAQEIAGMAGLKSYPEGDLLLVPFDMGGGRGQTVAVAEFGKTPDGETVLSFSSPCMKHDSGFFSSMTKERALDLLRRNSASLFGIFALLKDGQGNEYLCVKATGVLETMEVEEFRENCMAVTHISDAYERECGKDDFK